MEKMTIKAYAVKHRLSIFNVVKMVKSGKLQTETIEENGKERVYILLDEKKKEEVESRILISETEETAQLKEELALLGREVSTLRTELDALKKSLL